MREKILKRLGWIAVFLGFYQTISYLYGYFFITTFYSLAPSIWVSLLCMAILLVLAGIYLIRGNSIGILILKGYIFGTIADILLIIFLYHEYVSTFNLLIPALISISYAYILFFSKYSSFFKVKHKDINQVMMIVAIAIVLIIPKLF